MNYIACRLPVCIHVLAFSFLENSLAMRPCISIGCPFLCIKFKCWVCEVDLGSLHLSCTLMAFGTHA